MIKMILNIQMFPGSIYLNIVCISLYFVHLSLYHLYCLLLSFLPLVLVNKLPVLNLKCQIKPCLPRPPAEIRKTTNPFFSPAPCPPFPTMVPL
jgi:hypothetical protein